MRKTVIGMLVATSLLVSGGMANAAVGSSQPLTFTDTTASFGFAFGPATSGQTFDEDFTFTLGQSSALTSAVISIALGTTDSLNITGFTLENSLGATIATGASVLSSPTSWALTASNLAAGNYTLDVEGLVTGTRGGSFGGNINVSPVPEASTSAMLLGGLALVGFAATRRRQNKDAAPPMGMFAA